MERPLQVVRSKEEMRVTTWSGIATGKTATVWYSTATAEQQKKSETVEIKWRHPLFLKVSNRLLDDQPGRY